MAIQNVLDVQSVGFIAGTLAVEKGQTRVQLDREAIRDGYARIEKELGDPLLTLEEVMRKTEEEIEEESHRRPPQFDRPNIEDYIIKIVIIWSEFYVDGQRVWGATVVIIWPSRGNPS